MLATIHQTVGVVQFCDCFSIKRIRNSSSRLLSHGFEAQHINGLFRNKIRSSRLITSNNKALTSISCSLSVDHTSSTTTDNSQSVKSEACLVLLRHGESWWNERNLFTGCVDVGLTIKGVEEAIEAGKRISYLPIDIIYTSSLIRAQTTAMLAMTKHRSNKVPIIIHDESDQAKVWSQIYSEDTKSNSIPVITTWELNERMYGELQGFNKQETAEKYGMQKVHDWRRSFDVPPPNGESLEMCAKRAVSYFKKHIEPVLRSGKNVLLAAHANSLRSIIMYLDKLSTQEIIGLELSNGVPLLYTYKDGEFINRGSDVGLMEPDEYAYTEKED